MFERRSTTAPPTAGTAWVGDGPQAHEVLSAMEQCGTRAPGASLVLWGPRIQPDQVEAFEQQVAAFLARGEGNVLVVSESDQVAHVALDLAARRVRERTLQWCHESAAAAAARRGVRINRISLGVARELGHPVEAVRHVERFTPGCGGFSVRAVVRALLTMLHPLSTYCVGQNLRLDGGLGLHWIPPTMDHGPGDDQRRPGRLRLRPATTLKRALIVGASSGIGAAVADRLAASGVEVVLVARREEALRIARDRIRSRGGSAEMHVADVSLDGAATKVVRAVEETFGPVDGLVYAAGVFDLSAGGRDPDSVLQLSLNVNFLPYAEAAHELCLRWRKQGVAGSILAVSSVGGGRAMVPHMQGYAASKAAMEHFTRSLALTVAPYGIRANCLAPGLIRTRLADAVDDSFLPSWLERIPLGRQGITEELAPLANFLLTEAAPVTGEVIRVDGGFSLSSLPAPAAPPC